MSTNYDRVAEETRQNSGPVSERDLNSKTRDLLRDMWMGLTVVQKKVYSEKAKDKNELRDFRSRGASKKDLLLIY